MLLPRARPGVAAPPCGSGCVRSRASVAPHPLPPPRAALRCAPPGALRQTRLRGAALVAAAKRAAASPPPPPPPAAEDEDEAAAADEEDASALDFKAVVKLHCTTLDPDWVNPWQARVAPRVTCLTLAGGRALFGPRRPGRLPGLRTRRADVSA